MEKNRTLYFWLTVGSMINLLVYFISMLIIPAKEQIIFKKEYCLFMIPLLLYSIFQFIINYVKVTEEDD
jgi:prolipoprotein diacylglyceryltransferase